MTKHTPGPWSVFGQAEVSRYIIIKSAKGRTVARIPFNTHVEVERDQITDCHDADLISAAPDLLEALKALVDTYGSVKGPLIRAALAAIAKAEGS